MENIIVYLHDDEQKTIMERIFKEKFSKDVNSINPKATVHIRQRNQIHRNKYNVEIYCNGDEVSYSKIFSLLNRSSFDFDFGGFAP